jgi:DNA (cytosine-5)-methyltransferase 1
MRYLSVCSGIEAASMAWSALEGWQPVAFSEIEPFPCAVLKHHHPTVPNWGDMTKFQEWPDATIDLLVGGTPCQSFSIAGLREGLRDPRGNLALTFLAIADRYRPKWVVWENVPGVLSATDYDTPDPVPPPAPMDMECDGQTVDTVDEFDSVERHAFGSFVSGLSELGYGFAYASLDAQYFNVAQRRQRVFVVGCLGETNRAAAVLFDRSCVFGHPAPSRASRERIAPPLAARTRSGGGSGTDVDLDGGLIPECVGTIAGVSNGGGANGPGRTVDDADTLIPELANPLTARMTKGVNTTCDEGHTMIAFDTTQITHPENRCNPQSGDPCHPLAAEGHPPAVAVADVADPVAANQARTYTREGSNNFRMSNVAHTDIAVRRLTPRECERLQGFPDDYTLIKFRGKPAADGPRYKALGNSMAVPVMRWIGERIQLVEEIR